MIKVKNLCKEYIIGNNIVKAIDDVSFSINKGEFTTLTGPSGSGKTTLLYLIGALDKASKGSIIIENKHIEKLSEKEKVYYRNKYIGFIFQNFHLISYLTTLENIAIPLKLRKIDKKQRISKAKELLEKVGLTNREKHLPGELSGGEKQRVAIARAIIGDPILILADEPTGNLDTKNRNDIVSILCNLQKEKNMTIIVATHNLEISSFSNKNISLSDGKIKEESK